MNNKLLYKTAQLMINQEREDSSAGKLMAQYVGVLRGLAIIHQFAHWVTKGDNFYEDHLLFGRIYETAAGDIDALAEKLIGVFGVEFMQLDPHVSYAHQFVGKLLKVDNLIERSLAAEKAFLEFSETLVKQLKDMGKLTLGLEDMLPAVASKHEENVYLLKQKLGK